MRTIIAGSRDITDYDIVEQAVENSGITPSLIISGTARGVDQLGEAYAIRHNIELHRFPAHWESYGKAAGFLRNKEMALQADCLIAVWDGESKGTQHMIDTAKYYNLQVYIEKV